MASFKELKDQQAALRAAVQGGARIIQPEEAAERLKAEKIAKVQAHLDMADVERDAAVDLFNMLVLAETRRSGVPGDDQLDRLREIAKQQTAKRYAEKWTARAALFAELGVTEMDQKSSHWVWAAKQHGVDLVPVPTEAPRLVTG